MFEGCLIQLESHGPVQLILSCTAGLLDAGRFSESQLASLVMLVRTCASEFFDLLVTRSCSPDCWPWLASTSPVCITALSVHGSNGLQLGRLSTSVTVLTPCIDAFIHALMTHPCPCQGRKARS